MMLLGRVGLGCGLQQSRTHHLSSPSVCPLKVSSTGASRASVQSAAFRKEYAGGLRAFAGARSGLAVTASLVAAPAAVSTKTKPSKGTKQLSSTRYDDAGISVDASLVNGDYQIAMRLDNPRRMMLHWAVDEWSLPAQELWPAGTVKVDDKAVQSPFAADGTLSLTLRKDACPTRIIFVLKALDPEVWTNNNGANYVVQLKTPGFESLANKVLAAEGTYTNWSLYQRLALATELLDAAESAGPTAMALIFTWLRLSSTRVLDWYRNSNYQSKDIAHMQKYAAERMAAKARGGPDQWCRLFARGALAGMPRGGGNGDDIRMGILHIMRGNGIKEGHRPGHDEPFLEQWHQKLHTNTTPDDITICEAYLAFLHSGNHDDYWRVLWDNGKLNKEKMSSWSKPVTAWPHHLPHLIDPFKGYLWTLKTTHSGANLDTALEMAKGCMDDDLRWTLFDILGHRHEWWVPGKIVEARHRLQHYWKAPNSSRDLLLLDIALDSYLRTCLERVDLAQQNRDSLVEMVALVLRNAQVCVDDEELNQCSNLWERLRSDGNRWSPEWSMAALAAAQRTQLSLSAYMDTLYQLVQPHAKAFGEACKLDPASIMNFGEEVVRGQALFVMSPLLQQLEPQVRAAAGVAAWQIVSQAAAIGEVTAVASLADIQGEAYDQPLVLLATEVGGMEDIPAGVVAVLTRSSTDVLSHVAIRARSQGVLLATCFDAKEWDAWQSKAGQKVAAVVDPAGSVIAEEAFGKLPAAAGANGNGNGAKVQLAAPTKTDHWALAESDFTNRLVGAKALNLKKLRSKLPDWIQAPASVALPFGTFEKVLKHPANADVAAELAKLQKEAAAAVPALPAAHLAAMRELVSTGLVAPPELIKQLAATAAGQGLLPAADHWTSASSAASSSDEDVDEAGGPLGWPAAWSAISAVWASKWTDRAWLSRRAQGLKEEEVFMSVLLQQVVPAQYAFVLHTANPVTHTVGELLGEVVVGMGETLVGNYPGRALGFTAGIQTSGSNGSSKGSGAVQGLKVLSLPSKRTALHAPEAAATLIARSDANAEDLDEYAAAGLYDSVTLQPLQQRPVDYSQERLTFDPAFRSKLIGGLVSLGGAVRDAFGGREQDIEGVWVDEKFYVVQARPQVMAK